MSLVHGTSITDQATADNVRAKQRLRYNLHRHRLRSLRCDTERPLSRLSWRRKPMAATAMSSMPGVVRQAIAAGLEEIAVRASAHLTTRGGAKNVRQLQRRRHARPQGSHALPAMPGFANDVSCDDALRPSEADLVEIQVGMLRADMMKDAGDWYGERGSSNPPPN